MLHRVLILSIALVGSSCSFELVPHAWQVPGRENEVTLSTATWRKIDRASHCRVESERREEAASKLANAQAVRLTVQEAVEHCPDLSGVEPEGWSPYLVRGVAEPPAWCLLVRYDEVTRQLVVYQAWYNGESMLFLGGQVEASPVIVFLPTEPLSVLPVGEEMGDHLGATECYRDQFAVSPH